MKWNDNESRNVGWKLLNVWVIRLNEMNAVKTDFKWRNIYMENGGMSESTDG